MYTHNAYLMIMSVHYFIDCQCHFLTIYKSIMSNERFLFFSFNSNKSINTAFRKKNPSWRTDAFDLRKSQEKEYIWKLYFICAHTVNIISHKITTTKDLRYCRYFANFLGAQRHTCSSNDKMIIKQTCVCMYFYMIIGTDKSK
jgi:hypothetical protein